MPKVSRNCACCGASFKARPDSIAKGWGKFCSITCKAKVMKRTHGHTVNGKSSPTYKTWQCMRQRCYVPAFAGYEHYGARGITVCDAWRDNFDAFLADMGERPEGRTLDRIDVSLGYSKDNCRWATPREQSMNMRTNHLIEFEGVLLPISEAARRAGLRRTTVSERIKRGWAKERWLDPITQASRI